MYRSERDLKSLGIIEPSTTPELSPKQEHKEAIDNVTVLSDDEDDIDMTPAEMRQVMRALKVGQETHLMKHCID